MDRQRSPNYPALSLEQSIDMVGKIHKENRTNVIGRETAARDMGYTGLTGRSLTVLASLAQYGLVEKAGKGDIKVTRRAVEILHPVEEAHRIEALLEAAHAPALFRMLTERFPDGVPSANALRSYLVQSNFNDVAIGQAISAFLETNAFAEKAKESARNSAPVAEPRESPSQSPQEDHVTPTTAENTPSGAPKPLLVAEHFADAELNRITMNIQGGRVMVSGLLDVKGLRLLEKKIASLKVLLAPDDDEVEEGETVKTTQ
jgi:hypothetical protein